MSRSPRAICRVFRGGCPLQGVWWDTRPRATSGWRHRTNSTGSGILVERPSPFLSGMLTECGIDGLLRLDEDDLGDVSQTAC
ncbi:hypothetical protein Trydic_g18612 [Trypoxylus dichotomus]